MQKLRNFAILAICAVLAVSYDSTMKISDRIIPKPGTEIDVPHVQATDDDKRFEVQTSPVPVSLCESILNATAATTRPAQEELAGDLMNGTSFTEIPGLEPMHTGVSPNETFVLRQPQARGRLRHDWSSFSLMSHFAKQMAAHQSNCSLPVSTFHIDNSFGLGAHVALWSESICNAMATGTRLRTYNPIWLWLDQTSCSAETAEKSPLLCYFPDSEFLCGLDENPPNVNISDPRLKERKGKKREQCKILDGQSEEMLHEFRAATTEFLFHNISSVVIEEAQRQVGLLFGPDGTPDDLITVHIRWGDKFWEMDLAPITEYIESISSLLQENQGHNCTANIYLATEDPRAVAEFKNATPPGWTVYYDRTVEEMSKFRPKKGNRASWTSKNTKGRAGLVGVGSFLVAMESKMFVLTTKSNWSRLMDHLRTNVINPHCNGCTKMIDLRPGLW